MGILGLFDADPVSPGVTVQLDRIYYGPQTRDVSQGRTPDGTESIAFSTLPTPGVANAYVPSETIVTETLVAESDEKIVVVPTEDIGSAWQSDLVYDTAGWHTWDGEPGAIGFDSGDGAYVPLIGLDLEAEMDDINATCYVRIPFNYSGDPAELVSMSLNVRYDDGFIAYLNGTEIRRENFNPDEPPQWNSEANDIHDDALAVDLVSFDVTSHIGALNVGENLLALHVLNEVPGSSDVLLSAELVAQRRTAADNPIGPLLDLHAGLRITELMYNPPGSDTKEYIELQNVSDREIDLTGVRFTDGFDFVFPSMTLAPLGMPGEYVVLVRNLAGFEAWYGTEINVAGVYDPDALGNGGEDVVLRMPEPYDAAILRFEYDDDWYPSTDGDGASLVINDPAGPRAAWQEREGWHAGSVSGGSPGAADPVAELPIGAVAINEILAHSALPNGDDPIHGDWIELVNTTETDIDVSGWFLSDDVTEPKKFVIPGDPSEPFGPGNTILAGSLLAETRGILAFNQLDHFGFGSGHAGSLAGFGLSEHGDEVILSSADIAGNLGPYQTFAIFDATANGVTLGRHITSTGVVDFVALAEPTYETANAPPMVGPMAFEEIMYHPPNPWPVDGGNEYVLLRNTSGGSVALYDTLHPSNTWSITGGIEFTFPEGVTVAADQFVLITDVEPADYLATHPVPDGVQVFGPFVGALSNAGERLTLQRPGKPETLPESFVPQIAVETVQYDDDFPWSTLPDGDGPALTRLAAEDYGNDPANWGFSGPPVVTVDPLTTADSTPALTGTVADAHSPTSVLVTVGEVQYEAEVVDGVWTLPDNTISPALEQAVYDVVAQAVDPAGNLGTDATTGELVVRNPDAYEPNDDRATAYDLTDDAQQWLSSSAGFGRQWDDDWYTIGIATGETKPIVVLRGEGVGDEMDLELFDADGAPWLSPRSGRSDDHVLLELPLSDESYLKVSGDNSGRAYDLWWGTPHPGDVNLDGTTDVRDFMVWNVHKFTDGTDWTTGDFTGDGVTDVRDFMIWNVHKFTSAPAPAPALVDRILEAPDAEILPADIAWPGEFLRTETDSTSFLGDTAGERTNAETIVDKLLASYWDL